MERDGEFLCNLIQHAANIDAKSDLSVPPPRRASQLDSEEIRIFLAGLCLLGCRNQKSSADPVPTENPMGAHVKDGWKFHLTKAVICSEQACGFKDLSRQTQIINLKPKPRNPSQPCQSRSSPKMWPGPCTGGEVACQTPKACRHEHSETQCRRVAAAADSVACMGSGAGISAGVLWAPRPCDCR